MTIQELKAAMAAIQQKVAALAAIEATGTTLSAEQLAEFAQHQADFAAKQQQLDRALSAEKMAQAAATPVDEGFKPGAARTAGTVPAVPKTAAAKGADFAAMVLSIAHGGKDKNAASTYAEGLGYPDVAAALNKTTPTAGGYMVPPGYVAEVIELLRPNTVIRSSGVRSIRMPNGRLNMGRQNTSSTASYGAEGADIAKSEPTLGEFNLTAKKLTALVPISNDLIRYADPSALAFVMDDMRAVIGSREDLAFLRDNGTGDLVKGLRYAANASNIIPAQATPTLVKITQDRGKALAAIKRANVPTLAPIWVMHPDVEQFLMDLRDGNGNLAFPEMARGLWGSLPYKTTTQIPTNLGVGTNETEVYLYESSQCVIGDALDMVLDVSQEASYVDGGNLVSAFSRDQTVVRSISAHDFGLRHDLAAAVLTAVTWRY